MSAREWLAHVRQQNPQAEALYASATRDEFLDAVERLLGDVVQRMEQARAEFRVMQEPGLSFMVVQLLGKLVPATSETHSNGHVDVTIRHPRGLGFCHLTECKIWNGQKRHREGMQQLLGYATGREGRVMCLEFFVRHKRMVFLLGRLREQLPHAPEPPSRGTPEDHPFLEGGFTTCHEHSSGFELRIVHFGCSLWEEGCEDLGEGEPDEE